MRIAKNTRPNRPMHIIRDDKDAQTLCGFVASRANGWRVSEDVINASNRAWFCNSCKRAEGARVAHLKRQKSIVVTGEARRDAEFAAWERMTGKPHPSVETEVARAERARQEGVAF